MSAIMRKITKGKLLGRGSYANVYLGIDKRTGEQFALKELVDELVDDEAAAAANKEAELLRNLDHASIVK